MIQPYKLTEAIEALQRGHAPDLLRAVMKAIQEEQGRLKRENYRLKQKLVRMEAANREYKRLLALGELYPTGRDTYRGIRWDEKREALL
jgi:hypothetical protein